MKKVLAGCLIVIALAFVAFGVAGYYAYRAAKPMIDSAGDYVTRAREMASIGDRITNKAPYGPPAKGELTPGQVDRFLAVQARVRSAMGDRWSQIEAKSAEIQRKTERNKSDLSLTELSNVFSDLADIYIEARKVQVNAFNVHKFSNGEYTWVRKRVYEAAGVQLAHGIDMSAIEDMARDGVQKSGMNLPDMPVPDVPPANIKLVKPHTAKLKEWLPMAVLGL
jgi:hypothetical protein